MNAVTNSTNSEKGVYQTSAANVPDTGNKTETKEEAMNQPTQQSPKSTSDKGTQKAELGF